MNDDSIELMLSSDEAVKATHRSSVVGSEEVTGIFQEIDDQETDQRDDREGDTRNRRATYAIPSSVVVTLGKTPSTFQVRGELWTATGIAVGRGVQTVRMKREEQATQTRKKSQSHS